MASYYRPEQGNKAEYYDQLVVKLKCIDQDSQINAKVPIMIGYRVQEGTQSALQVVLARQLAV
jgi:hypothetical protein